MPASVGKPTIRQPRLSTPSYSRQKSYIDPANNEAFLVFRNRAGAKYLRHASLRIGAQHHHQLKTSG